MTQAPLRNVGPYQLLALLGAGTMGAVYRTRHRDLPVDRALKLLPSDRVDPKRLQRFEREGRNLARVQHPNVVRVHEAGADAGRPFLVMDLVEGQPLERLLVAERLSLERALALGLGVARGVGALHEAGIIHRDLKPENVLVRADGVPVVVDLGLALAPDLDERLTRTGAAMGTPLAMAPEQLLAQPVGPQADVWALGLILFHLLTGQSAAPAVDSMAELLMTVTRVDRPRPGSVDPELPEALDDLVARTLSRAASRRPPDARAVAAELEAIQSALGRGRLPTAGSQRRRRRLAVVSLALLAAVGAGSATKLALDASGPVPPASPPATEAPAVTSSGPPLAQLPDAATLAEAARQLDRASRIPDESARLVALREWLERWPGHPEHARALDVVRELRVRVPLQRVSVQTRLEHVVFLDDRRVRAVDGKGTLEWDLDGGAPRRFRPEIGPIAVSRDPLRVLRVTRRGRVRVYGPDGRLVGADFSLEGDTTRLAVTPDGRLAIAGGPGGTAWVFAPLTGRVVAALHGHRQGVSAVAITADGALAVTGSGAGVEEQVTPDNAVRIWRLPAGTHVRRVEVHGRVSSLAVRPGSAELLVATSSHRLYVLSLAGTDPPIELVGAGHAARDTDSGLQPRAHRGAIREVAVSPDGRWAWSVSGGDTVSRNELRSWDLAAREERYHLLDRERPVRGVAVSPDGTRIVTTSDGGLLELWAVSDGAPAAKTTGDAGDGRRQLRRVARVADEAERAAALDEWLGRWPDHVDRGEAQLLRAQVPERRLEASGRPGLVRFLDDRRAIVTSTAGLQAFDLDTGETRVVTTDGGPIAIAASGRRVLLGAGPRVHVLGADLAPAAAPLSFGAPVIAVALSPDGRLAVCGEETGLVHVVEAASGRRVAELAGHRRPSAVATSLDAALVITGSGSRVADPGEPDDLVRLWRLPGAALVRSDDLAGAVCALAPRPASDEVVAGTSGGRVYVLSLRGSEPPRELVGEDGGHEGPVGGLSRGAHEDAVRDVACSADGRWAWSVSKGQLRCWDLAARRERYAVLGREPPFRSVHVAPAGRRLVTSSETGHLELWPLP